MSSLIDHYYNNYYNKAILIDLTLELVGPY